MTFVTLLEAMMRYREATWRDDVIVYENTLKEGIQPAYDQWIINYKTKFKRDPDGATIRNWNRDVERSIKNKVEVFTSDCEIFNKACYKMIERVTAAMSDAGKVSFDNFATGVGMVVEEYVKASNTTQFLTVCKLFNQGYFDSVFAEIEKLEKERKAGADIDTTEEKDHRYSELTDGETANLPDTEKNEPEGNNTPQPY